MVVGERFVRSLQMVATERQHLSHLCTFFGYSFTEHRLTLHIDMNTLTIPRIHSTALIGFRHDCLGPPMNTGYFNG